MTYHWSGHGVRLRLNSSLKHVEFAVRDTVDGAMTAGAKHDEVGNLRDPTLFGLGQGDAVMGLDDLDAVDL